MYARVATFEGGSADDIRSATAGINEQVPSGPPEGVDSVGFTVLADHDNGRVIAIGLFEDMDKLRAGDAVLNEMSPPGGNFGRRVSVDVYEVPVDVRM